MTPLDEHVLAVCAELRPGGGYNWKKDDPNNGGGCLEPLVFKGATILRPGPGGTYCTGLTLNVLWRAWARAGFEPPINVAQMRALQRSWFCVVGRSGPVNALVPFGLGEDVSANPTPGSFAQLWRRKMPDGSPAGSGHSVIVLGWDGVNLRYLSTQASTNGIGERIERPAVVYAARALAP